MGSLQEQMPGWRLLPGSHSDPQLAPASLHRSEVGPANQPTSETVTLLLCKVRNVGPEYRFKMETQRGLGPHLLTQQSPACSLRLGLCMSKLST